MTSRNRSDRNRSDEAPPQRPSSVGQWLLGTLVVLALAASLLMIFGNDFPVAATLAVIAALWAAVIGAVLVTKYRKQADVAESRSKELRLVYELQLEREIAARRQYESDVESAIRHEVAAESNVELEELKVQVLALRASLEQLLGKPLPDVRAAIGLDRPRELSSGLRGADYAQAVDDDRVVADRDFASTAPPVDPGRHVPEEPQDAEEVDPGQLTEIIPVVTDAPAYPEDPYAEPAYEAEADPAAENPAAAHGESDYSATDYSATEYSATEYSDTEYRDTGYSEEAAEYVEPPRDPDTGSFARAAYGAAAYEPPPVPPQTGPIPVQEMPESADRGRRGAADGDDGAHSAGLPASELLSQLRAASGNGAGRSRRRRD